MSRDPKEGDPWIHELAVGWGYGFSGALIVINFYLEFYTFNPAMQRGRGREIIVSRVGALWAPTQDPVLNVLIDMLFVVAFAYATYGGLMILYRAAVVALKVGFVWLAVSIVVFLLSALAHASATGAILAVAIVLVSSVLFVRAHHVAIANFLARITPLGNRRRQSWSQGRHSEPLEEMSMADRRAEADAEPIRSSLEQFRTAVSSAVPVPENPLQFNGWLRDAVRRMEMESVQHTVAKHAELVKTARGLEEELARYYRARDERRNAEADSRARTTTDHERERLAEEMAREHLATTRAEALAKRLEAEVRAEKARQELGILQRPPERVPQPQQKRDSRETLERQVLAEEEILKGDLSPVQREIHQANLNDLIDRLRRMG